jgi:hypothetical protein
MDWAAQKVENETLLVPSGMGCWWPEDKGAVTNGKV